MKIDLTQMPREEQIAVVGGYLLFRKQAAEKTGQKCDQVFATDLMQKFKHRGQETHGKRVEFFTGLLRDVCKAAHERTPQGIAEKIVAEAPKA